jgi:hypothetical protein
VALNTHKAHVASRGMHADRGRAGEAIQHGVTGLSVDGAEASLEHRAAEARRVTEPAIVRSTPAQAIRGAGRAHDPGRLVGLNVVAMPQAEVVLAIWRLSI